MKLSLLILYTNLDLSNLILTLKLMKVVFFYKLLSIIKIDNFDEKKDKFSFEFYLDGCRWSVKTAIYCSYTTLLCRLQFKLKKLIIEVFYICIEK